MQFAILLCLISSCFAWFYGRDPPDAWTQGGVFPLPKTIEYITEKDNRTISPSKFLIKADRRCDILKYSLRKYEKKWIFPFPVNATEEADPYTLEINFDEQCPETVPEEMNEDYVIHPSDNGLLLEATTVWGVLRGLETFSQLVFYDEPSNAYKVRNVRILDSPRFSVRGLMLDSARHFLPVSTIKRQLELMAQNKMNVFHWHLVDSEAFPFESRTFPELSLKGAYSKRHVYSIDDVSGVINFARLHGIRVIPEFDTPGHTGSWRGIPGLLTDCYDESGIETNLPNLIDPTHEGSFEFLAAFFKEIAERFPDNALHLGGDEVSDYILDCWSRNEKIQKFMQEKDFKNTTDLENYYFERLQSIIANVTAGKTHIYWQEVFDNNNPRKSAIIHIWKGDEFVALQNKIQEVTSAGHRVIVSACWYLNYIKYGADWRESINGTETNSRYYYCDPRNFTGTPEQKDLVLGGIAAIWGELVDSTNLEARLWPRASAVAERLWSPAATTRSAAAAWPRLHEMRCRQISRGFRVQPINWPDYCPFEWKDDIDDNDGLF